MGLLRCYDTDGLWRILTIWTHYRTRSKIPAKNAGFASGVTLGLGITLGGLVAPYIGHLADIYDVQTALMTLIPVGLMGLLMSLWLKEPK